MLRFICMLMCLFAATTAYGARPPKPVSMATSVSHEFIVRSSYERTCDWIEGHKNELYEAGGNKVLSRDKDVVKLRRTTPREVFEFTATETAKRGTYYSTLKESLVGSLTMFSSELEVRKEGTFTVVKIYLNAQVSNPRITMVELKANLTRSANNIRDRIKKELD